MKQKHVGDQTIRFADPPSIIASACVGGKKEGEGPLRGSFDRISRDSYFGQRTWEKAESAMQKQVFSLALEKARLNPDALDYIFAGDLLDQCTASAFSMRDSRVPFFGLYGACSTMAEALSLGAMCIDGGFADTVCALTSSHFCSAERQFRLPLEYGGQRTPTAQWTATAAGAAILSARGCGPYITAVTTGRIRDAGITDAGNMGAAMAPAAYETICAHLRDLDRQPKDYDLIVTGDLGLLGRGVVMDFFLRDGLDVAPYYDDCGMLLYDRDRQDVHAGGSGCGCSASVLCGWLLEGLRSQRWNRLLFCATGALLSPTTTCQGESIPGICHAVCICNEKEG
jgi:stage V sporulation protein AD